MVTKQMQLYRVSNSNLQNAVELLLFYCILRQFCQMGHFCLVPNNYQVYTTQANFQLVFSLYKTRSYQTSKVTAHCHKQVYNKVLSQNTQIKSRKCQYYNIF